MLHKYPKGPYTSDLDLAMRTKLHMSALLPEYTFELRNTLVGDWPWAKAAVWVVMQIDKNGKEEPVYLID